MVPSAFCLISVSQGYQHKINLYIFTYVYICFALIYIHQVENFGYYNFVLRGWISDLKLESRTEFKLGKHFSCIKVKCFRH